MERLPSRPTPDLRPFTDHKNHPTRTPYRAYFYYSRHINIHSDLSPFMGPYPVRPVQRLDPATHSQNKCINHKQGETETESNAENVI